METFKLEHLREMITRKRKISLKVLLTLLVICCWFFPLTVVMSSMGVYSKQVLSESFQSELTTNADNAVELSATNLEYVITLSKQASYDEVIEAAYKSYESDENLVALYSDTTNYLQNSYQYNDYIVDTLVVYHVLPDTVYYANYYKNTKGSVEINEFWSTYGMEVFEVSETLGTGTDYFIIDDDLYLIRNIVDEDFEPYAVIIMELNYEEIFKSLVNIPFGISSEVMLDNGIINLLDVEESEDAIPYTYTTNTIIGGHAFVFNMKLDSSFVMEPISGLYTILTWLIALALPLLGVLIFLFYRHFSKPISELIEASVRLKDGEFGYQIDYEAKTSEFEYIKNQFNHMSKSMKNQIDTIYKEQAALQSAKIKALQSQINPHFLNNTLEVINWEVRLENNENAIEMLESLSVMLNASMARNENSLKRLKEELQYVDAYLTIISRRMGKRLIIKREIPENITNCEVPLLILQPIVENAVEHGISSRVSGELIIRIYETGTAVIVEIENDGILSREDQRKIRMLLNWSEESDVEHIGHSSLGIRNVNQRMKLIFGEEYGIRIYSTQHYSTLAQLRFPKSQTDMKK